MQRSDGIVDLIRVVPFDIQKWIKENTKLNAIKENTRQSTEQEYQTNVKIEDHNLINVEMKQERTIRIPKTEINTSSIYNENVHDKKYICKECNSVFEKHAEFIIHNNLSHKPSYVCKVCNAKFVLIVHLHQHMAGHIHDGFRKKVSVDLTQIQSTSKSTLVTTKNLKSIHEDSRTTLTTIQNYCITKSKINVQQNVLNNNSSQHFCEIQSNVNVQNTKSKSFEHVNFAFTTDPKTELLQHNDIPATAKSQKSMCAKITSLDKIYNYNVCNSNFTTSHKLNIHHKQHKQNFMCKKCNKMFKLKINFEKHLLSHTN